MSKSKDFYLNELSLQKVGDIPQARAVIGTFTRIAAALQQYGFGSLRHNSEIRLVNLEIAEGYFARSWLDDSQVDLETKRRFRSIATQTPTIDEKNDLLLAKSQRSDAYFQQKLSIGLTAACNADSIVVSFKTEDVWEKPLLDATMSLLNGDKFEENEIKIKNATIIAHYVEHVAWVKKQVAQPDIHHSKPLHFSSISSEYLRKHQKNTINLSSEERIAHYREIAKVVAALNFYELRQDLSQRNNRLVFDFGKGPSKLYLALDTQHGTFECHNHQGIHPGRI